MTKKKSVKEDKDKSSRNIVPSTTKKGKKDKEKDRDTSPKPNKVEEKPVVDTAKSATPKATAISPLKALMAEVKLAKQKSVKKEPSKTV